jgi:uncharacterized membrane protein YdjX (TVP38/TMEM64 family)
MFYKTIFSNWRKKLIENKNLLITLILFGLFYLVILFIFRKFEISQERINGWIGQFGAYSVVAILLLQFIGSMTPIPDTILTAIAMVLYGPFWGGVLIWCGMYTAGTMHFIIARKLGKEIIIKKFPEISKFAGKITGNNVITRLTYLRMFMVLSFDVPSYVAGISGVTYWQFTASFILGLIPHLVSYAFITQGLLANGSPLNIIPGVMIFLIMFIIANWPKKGKISNT